GFLVWALGAVLSASILASAAGSIAGGAAQAGASAIGAVGSATASAAGTQFGNMSAEDSSNYFSDLLLRSDSTDSEANSSSMRQDVSRIVAKSLSTGEVSREDRTYLAHLVASRSGLNPAEAEQRVDTVIQ